MRRGGWAGTGLRPKHARARAPVCSKLSHSPCQPRPEVGTQPGPAAPPCPQEPLGSAPGHCEPGPGLAPTSSPPSRKAGGRWRGCPASRAPPGGHSSPATLQPRSHLPRPRGLPGRALNTMETLSLGRSPGPPSSLGLPATQLPGPAPKGSPQARPGRSPRLCNQPSFTMATSFMVPGVLTLRSRGSPRPAVPTASGGSEGKCEAVSSWGHSSNPAAQRRAQEAGPTRGRGPGPPSCAAAPTGPSEPLLPAVSAPHPRPHHATCSLGLGPPPSRTPGP